MPCPSCESTARTFLEPGRWRCLGGTSYVIPAGWSGGPGLTNPFAGPGEIYHPERTVFRHCDTSYAVDDGELTAGERMTHDKAVVAADVDAQLPRFASVPRPSTRPPEVDYLWLAGLIAYWLVGTLVLWAVLAMLHAPATLPFAVIVGTAVFLVAFAQWWRHHADVRARHRRRWEAYERSGPDNAARESAREQLRRSLWAARPSAADDRPR